MQGENDCVKSFDEFKQFYMSLKEPELIVSNDRSLELMHNIFENINLLIKQNKDHQIDILELLCDSKLIKIFVNLFDYCLKSLEILIDFVNSSTDIATDDSGYKSYHYLNSLIQLIWCMTNFSVKFRRLFHSKGGTQQLFHYLSNNSVLDYFIIFKETHFAFLNEENSLLKAILGSIHNLSKCCDFAELNGTKILIELAHQLKKINLSSYLMSIYMTLANTLTDKEIEELPDTAEIVGKLVQIINVCANLIGDVSAEKTPRVKIDLENGRTENVCAIMDENDIQWDLVELISGLHRISVNDQMKYYIYTDCGLKEIVNRIIFHGNVIEKEYAIRLLYELSFDKKVASKVIADKNLLEIINKLVSYCEKSSKNSEMLKYCKGLLWILEKRISKFEHKSQKSVDFSFKSFESTGFDTKDDPFGSNGEAKKQKQIMISYNKNSRELCLRIKQCLENIGYKIWIDVENIHGSSLEAMADAIEKSDCILICMTEKYKMSPNCRAEAEYTFNIRKKFIPLIMQANYTPDGWLGLILGAKIYVDFTRYSFEVSMEKLRKELNQEISDSCLTKLSEKLDDKKLTNCQTNKITNGINKEIDKININDWNCDQVQNWLVESNINESIIDELEDFDGRMLIELSSIRDTASEYFFKSVSKNNTIKLSHVVKFSNLLRNISK